MFDLCAAGDGCEDDKMRALKGVVYMMKSIGPCTESCSSDFLFVIVY